VNLLFLIYPFFRGIWISLHDWDLMDDSIRIWLGFQNYIDLWNDSIFWRATWNTLYFVALTVPSMTILSLLLALAVSGGGRIRAICRSIFFLSSVFSVTVVTLVWTMVLSTDKGLIAPIFRAVGADPINFLGSPTWAMPSIVLATLWWGVGLPMACSCRAGLHPARALRSGRARSRLPLDDLLAHHPALDPPHADPVWSLQIVGQFQVFGQAQLMTNGALGHDPDAGPVHLRHRFP
jgi:multiple sugar transport system permease protein